MENITLKAIRNYFKEEGFVPRHNLKAFKDSINLLNREVEVDAFDLFLLIVENRPIAELNTHSYNFHTANGRYLIDTFKGYYYEFDNDLNYR
jgi:hypothetical protein